jgi:hypothetical protein
VHALGACQHASIDRGARCKTLIGSCPSARPVSTTPIGRSTPTLRRSRNPMRAPPCRKTAIADERHARDDDRRLPPHPSPQRQLGRANLAKPSQLVINIRAGHTHKRIRSLRALTPFQRPLASGPFPGFSLYGSTAVGSARYASGASRTLLALRDHLRGCDPRRRLAANSFRSDQLAADLSLCSMSAWSQRWWPLKRRRVLRCDRQSARCSRAGRRSTDRCARGRPRERLTAPSRRSP